MILDVAESYYKNDTEQQLRQAFQDDKMRREHGREEHYFCAESDEYRFCAEGEFDKVTLERTFIWYFNGDTRWKTQFTW